MRIRILSLLLCLLLLLSGCGKKKTNDQGSDTNAQEQEHPELGDDQKSFGASLDELGAYDGYFEGESTEISVSWVSGSKNAYRLEGTTLIFEGITEDSVYSVSGRLRGNIVIKAAEGCKLDLELCGLSLVSTTEPPIRALQGDEIRLTAKKDTVNYIYDRREAIDPEDETACAGAIFSEVDLEICGKGELKLISENNNGIHTKDDLQVKNLRLLVACCDNALKGNDSVEIESGELTLIASEGDGIKTSNSSISSKGNQKGSIRILGGAHTVYAACDAIDAAYDVLVEGEETSLCLYTDKYSNYSKEVTAVSESVYYIRFTSNQYTYSVKYIASDGSTLWVNAEHHSTVSGGRSSYYYYSFPRHTDYAKMQFFVYSGSMAQGQESEYVVTTDELTPSTSYDTFALTSRGSQLSYSWTNYTTTVVESAPGGRPGGPGGPGGMGEGNKDKGDHSTKGIKAANEIVIQGGTVSIKSYDDALHANNDEALENGASPLGNVTVNGGALTLYSNDDGIHADGEVAITGGSIYVVNSYEGIEGTRVTVSGGSVSVLSSDDGINATATSGEGVTVSGGELYIYCRGDGIDSNSRTSYSGIVFSGGKTVVISNSNGNSAIDTEQGYRYTGGTVLAIMPRGGMSNEATHCSNFSSIGCSKQLSLTQDRYLNATVGEAKVSVRMPVSVNALVIVLGDKSPVLEQSDSPTGEVNASGVYWN